MAESCVQIETCAEPCRSRAIAKSNIPAGSNILSCYSLSTTLLPHEKGRRCDYCHILATKLLKCSNCAEYYYCDATCQVLQWPAHKRICKKYTSSIAFQMLQEHEKLDAMLLSHTIAQLDADWDSTNALESVLSLLPGPTEPSLLPTIHPSAHLSAPDIRNIHARFGNNNFVLHSHLVTFGHGVFPLASSYFNHSCLPNAAAKYILCKGERPLMQVVALRDIIRAEEVCLTYLDPALLQSRQQIFNLSYGFQCDCVSCNFFAEVGKIPEPPTSENEREALSKKLQEFHRRTSVDGLSLYTNAPTIEKDLLPVFHEVFITHLSTMFRNSSHDGDYTSAINSGNALLALYRLIYPPNYPQIGLHLLEMAKTSWNSVVTHPMDTPTEKARKAESKAYLDEAKSILCVLGKEGDDDGPLVEIDMLMNLIAD